MSRPVTAVEAQNGDWELSSETLRVRVSGGQGADIRSIVHVPSGAELLWTDAGDASAGP